MTRANLGLILSFFLAACGGADPGNGGGGGGGGGGTPTCQGGCASGFACQGTTCVLDPTGQWVITVTRGQVAERTPNGSTWDTLGGAPDPFVCLTINGSRRCTSVQKDTLTPVWSESFPAATATALQSGVLVEMLDEDVAANDSICGAGTVAVTAESFRSGAWGAQCPTGSFSATLQPR